MWLLEGRLGKVVFSWLTLVGRLHSDAPAAGSASSYKPGNMVPDNP